MSTKRFTHKKWYDDRQLFDGDEPFAIVDVYIQAKEICNKLNKLHEENEDRFNEQMYLQKQLHNTQKELAPIKKICEKYRIPLKDLPEILEEYIAYDNDDNW